MLSDVSEVVGIDRLVVCVAVLLNKLFLLLHQQGLRRVRVILSTVLSLVALFRLLDLVVGNRVLAFALLNRCVSRFCLSRFFLQGI